MKELSTRGNQGSAAAKAGVCRQTVAKDQRVGKRPSAVKAGRTWRTRPDPFAAVWPELEVCLRAAPGRWARTRFEAVQERYPGQCSPGQLRTWPRRVPPWRARHGDDPEVERCFAQRPRPGEAAQTDFTHPGEVGLPLQGEPYAPLLCHGVLPYSTWQWAGRCRSEALLARKRGMPEALFRLGKVPQGHQTATSTGATHRGRTGQREFKHEYREVRAHLGMTPRTIAVGQQAQNGTGAAQTGACQRFLQQALLGRGSSDLVSEAAFDAW